MPASRATDHIGELPLAFTQEEINMRNGKVSLELCAQESINSKCGSIKEAPTPSQESRAARTVHYDIAYKLDDVPPWYLCLVLGMQHYLTMLGGTVTYPYLIAPKLCIREEDPARGYLISTTFFVSGICTFLQTTFGVRLPIVQGSTVAFLVPILAILQLPQWQCPTIEDSDNSTHSFTDEDWEDVWTSRMREVQGAIIGASLFEVAIGFTGLMGFLLTWITPLAIVPTITLVGLSLFAEAANSAAGHWGISFFTIFLLILFSQYMRDVEAPRLSYSRSKGWSIAWFPFFKLFPVLLTIVLAWGVCAILTATGSLPEGSSARTDLRLNILHDSPWFRFPYPGQWGIPTFSTAGVFGVLAGVLASAIESVGDYYACARLAGAPPPPKHAINRGIFVEGIGCVLSGIWGSGGGVTSYSENIGAIGITKVASRRVIQYGSAMMIVFGMLGKFGALFITVPEPIIGGVFCIMFSMITAVGLSSLQFVNLNSSRNLFILGFSLFMGLCIPKWLNANPGVIDTGDTVVNQIITVLLSTSMFVGGFLGFFLDNTIPGTDEERGIAQWRNHESGMSNSESQSAPVSVNSYDVPFVTPFFQKLNLAQYIPVSPTYKEEVIKTKILQLKNCLRSRKNGTDSGDNSLPSAHA